MKRVLAVALIALVSIQASFTQPVQKASPEEAKQLATLEKSYFSTKASFEKTKKPDSKKKFVVAAVKFGTASMTAASLPAKIKYRRALRLYREALMLEPTNAEALNNKKMIEDIYKSMGRPIPN